MNSRILKTGSWCSIGLALLLIAGARTAAHFGAQRSTNDERAARLARQLRELRETLRIPGLTAAIVKDRNLLWAGGFGYADLNLKTEAAPDTNYRIASLTKTFASVLLMHLVEQNRLELDAPISAYSIDFGKRFGTGPITVRHIATHTSHGSPGTSYRYDGDRFSYLTSVIEKASGLSFRELLVRTILDPLEMTGSVPGQDILENRAQWSGLLDPEHSARYEAALAKLAKPYRLYGEEIVQSVYPPRGISASAGIVSNALDLAKYDAALDGHRLITAATQQRAWTPPVSGNRATLPYAIGWFVQPYRDLQLIWHYGYWPDSFSSLYLKVPAKGLTFIVLANSDALSAPFRLGAGNVATSAFATDFLRIFVDEEALSPSRSLPDPRWAQTEERFTAEIKKFTQTTGQYRYESEMAAHKLLTRWLVERRASTRKEIVIAPDISESYVGTYRLDSGGTLRITRDNDRVFVEVFGLRTLEAFPEAKDKLFLKAIDMQLTFVKGRDGRVDSVEIESSGQRVRATRVN